MPNTTHEAEIRRLVASTDPRDTKTMGQALRDAQACQESRRAGPCDCFCCSLEVGLKARGYEIGRARQWR